MSKERARRRDEREREAAIVARPRAGRARPSARERRAPRAARR